MYVADLLRISDGIIGITKRIIERTGATRHHKGLIEGLGVIQGIIEGVIKGIVKQIIL